MVPNSKNNNNCNSIKVKQKIQVILITKLAKKYFHQNVTSRIIILAIRILIFLNNSKFIK